MNLCEPEAATSEDYSHERVLKSNGSRSRPLEPDGSLLSDSPLPRRLTEILRQRVDMYSIDVASVQRRALTHIALATS